MGLESNDPLKQLHPRTSIQDAEMEIRSCGFLVQSHSLSPTGTLPLIFTKMNQISIEELWNKLCNLFKLISHGHEEIPQHFLLDESFP